MEHSTAKDPMESAPEQSLMENKQATDVIDKGIDRHQLIIFKLGNEEYGIHIDQIKEVVLTPRVTKMPQTPSYVKGVANIRGNILAILDLEEKFGLGSLTTNEEAHSNYTLVAESKEFNIGVLVKEVPNTFSVPASDISDAVNLIQSSTEQSNYMLGIAKIDERLVILIDLFKVMQNSELNALLNETLVKD